MPPICIFAAVHLLVAFEDNPRFYPWILVYAASTTTTLLPCLAILVNTPMGGSSIAGKQINFAQLMNLYGSYVPFLLIPLVMTIDMAWRCHKLITKGLNSPNVGRALNVKKDAPAGVSICNNCRPSKLAGLTFKKSVIVSNANETTQ